MNYWIIVNNAELGPYTVEQLVEMDIDPLTPVWHEGLSDWLPAREVAAIEMARQAAHSVNVVVEPEAVKACDVTACGEASTAVIAPACDIPQGYVVVARDTTKCPPDYMVAAVITALVCFLPTGILSVIFANKVKKAFKTGDVEKAHRLSERTALFVCLTVTLGLIWWPFSMVLAMF